jgi:hypothetical protein
MRLPEDEVEQVFAGANTDDPQLQGQFEQIEHHIHRDDFRF